jgi:hypothetical protein
MLKAAEFHQLAQVPPAAEWLRLIRTAAGDCRPVEPDVALQPYAAGGSIAMSMACRVLCINDSGWAE